MPMIVQTELALFPFWCVSPAADHLPGPFFRPGAPSSRLQRPAPRTRPLGAGTRPRACLDVGIYDAISENKTLPCQLFEPLCDSCSAQEAHIRVVPSGGRSTTSGLPVASAGLPVPPSGGLVRAAASIGLVGWRYMALFYVQKYY